MSYQKEYQEKLMSAQEAVKLVRSGDRVYVEGCASFPWTLCEALYDRKNELEDVTVCCFNAIRPTRLIMDPEEGPFSISSGFLGLGERAAVKLGRKVKFTSFHLSQVDQWFHDTAKASVAFLEVSPPDEGGYMSLGVSGGGTSPFAMDTADRVILEVNKNVPYVTGERCLVHVSEATAIVESAEPLIAIPDEPVDEVTEQISNHIMELIPDGATVQLGIGKLSTAVGYGLRKRNDLGVHSEMFCEPMMYLMQEGNITNKRKGYLDGLSVYAFAMGSQKLYDFMDRNPQLYCGTFPYVNDPRVIAQNKRMISINSAMAIDVFGQVAADSLGWKQQSAVGGQLDFVRGAQWSEGGKSIIATASSFMSKGVRQSKIMLTLPTGTAVTTPRSDVQYVATEYGCVNLKELTMDDRVRAMISLAHPDFRDQLTQQAKELKLI